ncbi:DUF4261 domain-containing protein [Mucilaginibacter terrae]|uniref:DUF4261 domain-containing protein n=1 Tax=Mucilaginibacter terrae TaxID=1955052 RepID=A0ABU3GW80_9SPHI|nr:DUF4261 domain-containing protein [Mucilaginibacter terrae]MDT3403856.1 hypothetical protein [Mucilaginibacter terrae]
MGLFSFLKTKKEKKTESNAIFAMPMLINNDGYHIAELINDIESTWNVKVTDIDGDEEALAFKVNGLTVALGYIPHPIPAEDIEWAAKYAYNWNKVLEDVAQHTGHVIVTVFPDGENALISYTLLSKVLCSLLSTSQIVGVYHGTQSLIIPRERYLSSIEELQKGKPPVQLWIYIGLRKNSRSNSAYTYGLNEFGKDELEILNSGLCLEELYIFLLNISSYLISQNITLKAGETLGYTPEHKIKISRSKGINVDGETLKLHL